MNERLAPAPPRFGLAVTSGLALFVELALIRWLSSEVRVFAYFKSLVLMGCFLGFGLGFLRAQGTKRLGSSLVALVLLVATVAVPARTGWEHGPAIASEALSRFEDAITMGDTPGARVHPELLALGLAWSALIFLGCQVVLFGYAQRIGSDIAAFGAERRLEAYSWNVVGSLGGVLAFAGVSRLGLPPMVWFVGPYFASALLLGSAFARGCALVGAAVLALLLPIESDVVWSPYQRVEFDSRTGSVTVNHVGYMVLRSFSVASTPREKAGLDRWRLPHTVCPASRSVLVVGAGGGNDVSAAIRAGAERIVAVEIDPEVLALGKAHHPDHPYDDRRVEIILDDARHYAETTRETFDLVVFSHVDAHGALSSYTNVRLDNFLQTVESFRTFRRLLRPGGALFVSFQCIRPWLASRLHANLTEAFGTEPTTLLAPTLNDELLANFVASDDPAPRARAAAVGEGQFSASLSEPAPPSTDDWPYLYAQNRRIPGAMLWLSGPLLLLAGATCIAVARGGERARGTFGEDRQFFCLGAAFLLVEVHNVGKLARVFGTTWSVNAWVISGVLVMILAANFVASRLRNHGLAAVYALLVASLAACVGVPVEAVLAVVGSAGASVFYSLPLFFSGLIFARAFRDVASPERALAANVLGSVLGGFLELASFVVGLRGLLVIAGALYCLSFRPTATNPPEAGPGGAAW